PCLFSFFFSTLLPRTPPSTLFPYTTLFRSSSGGAIPAKYTCSGADVSPALSCTGTLGGAHSLVLTVIDPDAPGKPLVHWVIFHLPPASSDLSEGAAPPRDGVQGRNDFGSNG